MPVSETAVRAMVESMRCPAIGIIPLTVKFTDVQTAAACNRQLALDVLATMRQEDLVRLMTTVADQGRALVQASKHADDLTDQMQGLRQQVQALTSIAVARPAADHPTIQQHLAAMRDATITRANAADARQTAYRTKTDAALAELRTTIDAAGSLPKRITAVEHWTIAAIARIRRQATSTDILVAWLANDLLHLPDLPAEVRTHLTMLSAMRAKPIQRHKGISQAQRVDLCALAKETKWTLLMVPLDPIDGATPRGDDRSRSPSQQGAA